MKVLIIDDHPVLRAGLVALLRTRWPTAAILEGGTADEARALAGGHDDIDVALIDLLLPRGGDDGLAAIAELGRLFPTLPLIAVSAVEDPALMRRALAAGALGHVPKSLPPEAILDAVDTVLAGGLYLPPALRGETAGDGAAVAGGDAERPEAALERLTPRQLEVLRLVARGQSNRDIGAALGMSERTVKVHVTAILRRLGLANRTQAAGLLRDAGRDWPGV
jgi:DNA-binding NarL/FixJ family response regulator